MDELNQQYLKLEQKVLKIEADLRKKQTTESKLLEFAADTTKFEEVIKSQEEKLAYLATRIQSYINRECVLTEVSRYVRNKGSADLIVHFHIQLMKAYNWNDDFWEQRGSGSFTVKDWFDKIMTVEDIAPVATQTIEETDDELEL
jgi:cell division protein ZapA (FtsZ GTPase activity inhibitor)